MARLIPEEVAERNQGPWPDSEHATLNRLAVALSAEYTVFHGIHWARIDQANPVYGEIDFIVMNRHGRLLAIEQKDAPVTIVRNELVVHYRSQLKPKFVLTQVTRNLNGLRSSFERSHPGRSLTVDHLLYLPESHVSGELPAGVDASRVVDASNAVNLVSIIEGLFEANPTPQGSHPADPLDIHNFLSQRFGAMPHIGLLGERARSFSSRLSAGLATWASRLSLTPHRLHVKGTAGSGKTQLALQELQRAHRARQPSLYVCYNRRLSEAMKESAPTSAQVVTLHEMGREFLKAAGESVDFQDPNVYNCMAAAVIQYAPLLQNSLGSLVIDEAQDFEDAWVRALLVMAGPDTRVFVLEDAAQKLYNRAALQLPDWAVLESPVNYRSPRAVVAFINDLELTDTPIEWGGAVLGEEPRVYEHDSDSLLNALEQAVQDFLDEGFKPEQIAVLTLRGVANSPLFALSADSQVAGLRFKRATGQFSKDGDAIYSEGELLLETVHRFKGQAADAVVLVGDIESLETEDQRRRAFVGLTRARLAVSVVCSETGVKFNL
jgi:hypothetical protein